MVRFLLGAPGQIPGAHASRTRAVRRGGAGLDITGDSGETGRTTLPPPYPTTERAPIRTGRLG